jgi:BirA family biotin operon repressor/biotin-[acetyl-CoA-carboxylase] ligase
MAAAARVMDPDGKHLGLKWPNDLVAWKDGRLVKLGGILGEQAGARLILGLGVNLLSAPHLPERAIPPACLKDLGLACPDPVALAAQILHAWNDLELDIQPLFCWPEAGTPIRWEEGEGTCLGWERDGRLKVATADGIRRLSAGDVSGLS